MVKACNSGCFGTFDGRRVGNGAFCHFARVEDEVNLLVKRHERTAKRTADLRFSLVARVRLLEHVRDSSTASIEEIPLVNAGESPLPTADTQMNDRAFGWQACRNALLHGTPEGINGPHMYREL